MQYNLYDAIGNLGVALIIISYLLLQLNKLDSKNILYSLANAFGALFVIISLTDNFNLSAFIIEAFWMIISFVGIFKNFNSATAEK